LSSVKILVAHLVARLWLNPFCCVRFLFLVVVETPIHRKISDLLHVAGNVSIFEKIFANYKPEIARVISHSFVHISLHIHPAPPPKNCENTKIAKTWP
jgi:hypothetical protein